MAQPIVGRHEMHFPRKPNRSPHINVHCQDFRHGHGWQFDGLVTINPVDVNPFILTVSASASNMRGDRTQAFELPFAVEVVDVTDLVDPIKQNRKTSPAEALLERAIRDRDSDALQMLNFEKNWNELSGERGCDEEEDDDE